MPRISFFLLLSLMLSTIAAAQLTSNQYYEVLDSCQYPSHTIFPLKDGRLLSYAKKGTGPAYLLDKDRNKIELPCDKIELNRPPRFDCFECIQGNRSAFFSLQSDQMLSPFYDSLQVINPHFYMVWQQDSLYIFNAQNKVIFQTGEDISGQEAKAFFRPCQEEQLICNLKDEEFYLDTKGTISKDEICKNEERDTLEGVTVFKQDKKWGLKNKEGNILIQAKYQRIEHWRDDQYIVATRNEEGGKILYGILNQNEKVLLPIAYESIRDYEFGLLVRKQKCGNAFLDNHLKNKYDQEFDQLIVSNSGLVWGKVGNEKFYDFPAIQKNKGVIVSARSITNERFLIEYESGLFVIYDQLGQTIFNSQEKVKASKIYENVIQIELNPQKVGLLNAKGEWVVAPGNFSFKFTRTNDGIYKVKQDTRQSDLINAKGELIYANVKNGGVISTKVNYIVSRGQERAVVSPEGQLLIPFGRYRIHEFGSSTPGLYRLTAGNFNYIVQLK